MWCNWRTRIRKNLIRRDEIKIEIIQSIMCKTKYCRFVISQLCTSRNFLWIANKMIKVKSIYVIFGTRPAKMEWFQNDNKVHFGFLESKWKKISVLAKVALISMCRVTSSSESKRGLFTVSSLINLEKASSYHLPTEKALFIYYNAWLLDLM